MEPDTKTRILDAAEQNFAEHGFKAASLRTIIADAGVNLAAVHYHFGSKEALIEAVFARRIQPLNRERLELLDELERGVRGEKLPLERVIQAFLTPALHLARDPQKGGPVAMRLFGRTIAEPSEELQGLLKTQFAHVFQRFIKAFQRALPNIPQDVLCWRMHFLIGSMAHLLCMGPLISQISNGICDASNTDVVLKQMVKFMAAGLKASAE